MNERPAAELAVSEGLVPPSRAEKRGERETKNPIMAIVYIEGWPKGRPVHDYTIENAAGQILKSAKTLDEAIA